MKTYKIFNYDFKCRDFQYEIGKTYKIKGKLEVCKNGFHSCENPQDCFKYYRPNMSNKFAIVEASGEIKKDDDGKIVSSEITIIKELSFNEFVNTIKINAVNYSKAVSDSKAVNDSNAVNYSKAVSDSKAVNDSNAVNSSKAVNDSRAVNSSNVVNYSRAVNCSNAVNDSNAVYYSNAVSDSRAVNCSNAVYESSAVNSSNAVYESSAVNSSDAVSDSRAVNCSNAIDNSIFINKCEGISNSLFCSNIPKAYLLFNSNVTKERFEAVQEKLKSFNWLPKNSNIDELKERFGEYERIPIELIEYFKLDYSTMPRDMKEYIQSLPEYDDNIFNNIKESK